MNRPSSEKVLSNLIYNYKPTYSGYKGYNKKKSHFIIGVQSLQFLLYVNKYWIMYDQPRWVFFLQER